MVKAIGTTCILYMYMHSVYNLHDVDVFIHKSNLKVSLRGFID